MNADDGCRWEGDPPAGSVLDEHYTQTFAGHVRQLLIEDERDFCILADVFLSRDACRENCGGHGNEQRNLIHGAFSFGWRRSHSSKPMRPRRASPNGTSECSSTRPPKYRASGSLTTSRGSATAFR